MNAKKKVYIIKYSISISKAKLIYQRKKKGIVLNRWLLKSQEKKFNIMNYKDEILKKERIIISTS